ncbi:MAG TPA: hypothetical protein ENK99_07910 [Campylobacterales bacterium]|nr:hypothetical protein [Campylobacterales bacterium]
MNNIYRDRYSLKFFEWVFIIFIVGFYPMLVSIYPLLPPFIGIAGLFIIYTMDKNIVYPLSGMLYLVNLDLNLTLPFLLSIFTVIFIKIFIYSPAKLMIRCKVCLTLFLILLVDAFYYINLFLYDIILDSKTIIADPILSYYILSDFIIGFFL